MLDLGGSLFCRVGSNTADKHLIEGIKSDFNVKSTKIYLRPGFKDFLKNLLDHPAITLAFYTSITFPNAIHIIKHLLRDELEFYQDCLQYDNNYVISKPKRQSRKVI